MAEVGIHPVRLYDSDGDALDDGAGKLNVNATLVAGATIDIGDVDMFLDGGTAATGVALYAGDVYSVDIDNINDVYVLSSVDGEDVQWVYYV